MTDQQIATQPRRHVEDQPRSKAPRVGAKVAAALTMMVEDGTPWNEAAVKAGLTARAMRMAMERPHVIALMRAKKQVFREHISAANILRLAQIRDAADNMPAVNAIKALEQIADDPAASSAARHAPGVVIVIQNGNAADRAVTINAPDIRTDKDE